ncbi:MAG TPA: NHL repeat-containing protein [Chloroflexia bacterium]|nr:NHL repeat-containing protein [Chloroflexia bacterium]
MKNTNKFVYSLSRLLIVITLAAAISPGIVNPTPLKASQPEPDKIFFSQTGYSLGRKFLLFWQSRGGLAVFGYPISSEQVEVDPETGKSFLVQWFERARFELHPENTGTQYEVQLGLLGSQLKAAARSADQDFIVSQPKSNPALPQEKQWFIPESGHNLRLRFLEYWLANGGVMSFGWPISEEFERMDPENGQSILTQWFERARFEYHPENKPPYQVLLGRLGSEIKQPSYRVSTIWKLGQTLPNLIRPSAIGLDPRGVVYVANPRDGRVYSFTTSGIYLGTLSSFFTEISLVGLTVDSKGLIYVCSRQEGISKFDPSGELLSNFKFDAMREASVVKVDLQGNIYVLAHNYIYKFDQNGKELVKFGGYSPLLVDKGNGVIYQLQPGKFNNARGLAVDSQGNIYVSDAGLQTIQKFDSKGNFQMWFESNLAGNSGEKIYLNLSGLEVDRQGVVYAVNGEGVLKFNSAGHFLGNLALSPAAKAKEGKRAIEAVEVAIDASGTVYVVGMDRILKLDQSGKLLSEFGKNNGANGQFSAPYDVVTDKNSNLYVADSGNARIQKFDAQGHFLFSTGEIPQSVQVEKIALDSQDRLYLVDKYNSRIQIFDSNGHFQSTIPLTVQYPSAIDLDQAGNIYIADSRTVYKLDASGKLLTSFGNNDANENKTALFQEISALKVDPQGNIYVAEGLGEIKKIDSQGQLLMTINKAGQDKDSSFFPQSLAIDQKGYLYVANKNSNHILVFDSKGQYVTEFGSSGQAEGQLSGPGGLAVDREGNVLVSDTFNNRIQKFTNPVSGQRDVG